jgi:hypothetical protein
MLLRSLSAASQSLASKPRLAELLFFVSVFFFAMELDYLRAGRFLFESVSLASDLHLICWVSVDSQESFPLLKRDGSGKKKARRSAFNDATAKAKLNVAEGPY